MKLYPYLSLCAQVNSEGIKDLNVRYETENTTGKHRKNT
jgi:hypothetical protein